jgi:hypothetical protein
MQNASGMTLVAKAFVRASDFDLPSAFGILPSDFEYCLYTTTT